MGWIVAVLAVSGMARMAGSGSLKNLLPMPSAEEGEKEVEVEVVSVGEEKGRVEGGAGVRAEQAVVG